MIDIITSIKKLADNISLDRGWLVRTRKNLVAYMHNHPHTTSLRQPIASTVSRWFSFPHRFFRFAPAAVLAMVVIALTSVSVAARTSLPGDPLYSWKLGFNESIESVFAIGATRQAQFQISLVERRLNELSEVMARPNMSPQSASLARATLEVQTTIANDKLSRVASLNSESALQTALEFDAKLKAHKEIINLLEPQSEQALKSEVHDALQNIEKASEQLAGQITELEKKNQQDLAATSSSKEQQSVVTEKKEALDKRIRAALEEVGGIPASDPLATQVQSYVMAIRNSSPLIDQAIKNANYAQALVGIQKTLAAVTELEALLNTNSSASIDVKKAIEEDRIATSSPGATGTLILSDETASSSATFAPIVSVAMNKHSYNPGEELVVEIEATNPTSKSMGLSWNSSCQVDYVFDLTIFPTDRVCAAQQTATTVAAHTSHVWILKTAAPQNPGTHMLFATIIGYGTAKESFMIVEFASPSPSIIIKPASASTDNTY